MDSDVLENAFHNRSTNWIEPFSTGSQYPPPPTHTHTLHTPQRQQRRDRSSQSIYSVLLVKECLKNV